MIVLSVVYRSLFFSKQQSCFVQETYVGLFDFSVFRKRLDVRQLGPKELFSSVIGLTYCLHLSSDIYFAIA